MIICIRLEYLMQINRVKKTLKKQQLKKFKLNVQLMQFPKV